MLIGIRVLRFIDGPCNGDPSSCFFAPALTSRAAHPEAILRTALRPMGEFLVNEPNPAGRTRARCGRHPTSTSDDILALRAPARWRKLIERAYNRYLVRMTNDDMAGPGTGG